MGSAEDWRYDNLKHLQGATFRFTTYEASTNDSDHDHCRGCWAKFADFEGPDILHEGYVHAKPFEPRPESEFVTECSARGMRCIPQPLLKGCQLNWLCSQCFNDFRESLGFSLLAESTR